MNPRFNVRKIAFAGVIAALYAALTMSLSFISYGPIQFRIAEALTILPFFFPFSIWGLFVGCIIANLVSPYPLDIVVGPVASLIAGICTMQIAKLGRDKIPVKIFACFPPVIFNAVIIGAMIAYFMVGAGEADTFVPAFVLSGLQVGFGQLVILYAIGLPIMIYLPKSRIYEKMLEYLGNSE
ncbi:MAG: QueT transporter family protein [Oscillospiraceae bacterium]|nr:QueT transporter family protein [Oscillospiraceae bacterium]